MKPQTRKVQKLGLSSLGISLPKGWIKALGVEAGSTVLVHQEDDGSLRITTEFSSPNGTSAEYLIDAESFREEGFLERIILSSYMVGCNTIRIRGRGELDAGQIEEVQRALGKLTGVTPVDQGSKYLTLENFAEPGKFPLEGLLRRLQFLTSRMQNMTFQMVLEGKDLSGQIKSSGEEVQRLYNFAVRQLLLAATEPTIAKQIGFDDPRNIVGGRAFAILMQNLTDSFLEIAEAWSVPNSFPRDAVLFKELKGLWVAFNELAEGSTGAFFGRDMHRANQALDKLGKVQQEIHRATIQVSLPREREGPEYCATCLLLQSVLRPLRSVARIYGSVAQVAMNRGLERALTRVEAKAEGREGLLVPVS